MAVEAGMSLRKAAQIYSIPKSVIHRYIKIGYMTRLKHTGNEGYPQIVSVRDTHAVNYLNCQRVTYPCKNCGKIYNYYSSLARHLKHECGVEPKFHCPLCPYKTKHKSSLNTHLNGRHMKLLNAADLYAASNVKSSSMDARN
ncbi:zinc finger X-chromosomal protein-like [Pseudomyrmex gracilis]|uniref:zinc finger X-chromosomal protein-like n=1 Tax=Pseudomyrmex gracilis TaxID=219809 RepID=UPI0009949BE5|nr:zinc finger X-chromosomal protein-like [Pseudomyrmex gracilis]